MAIEPEDLYEGAIFAPILIKDFQVHQRPQLSSETGSTERAITDLKRLKASVDQLKLKMDTLTVRMDKLELKLKWMSWLSAILALCCLVDICRYPLLTTFNH